MGKDYILVETVGVGQDEVEIAAMADTTLVVTVPGLGDDIQALKAGLLEVADLLVVNKADREGAERSYQDLLLMLDMRQIQSPGGWRPKVYLTQAKENQGLEELLAGIREHQAFLDREGGEALQTVRYGRLKAEFLELLKEGIYNRLVARISQDRRLDSIVQAILAKRTDPYTASEALVAESLGEG
jgi:LAO/AO transport system kinase